MVELKGSLGGLGLPAIVQLIGELRHSGNLELTRGASVAVLGFNDGRLVTASYDDQRGLKALAACTLELTDGDFLFVEGTPKGERTIDLGPSELQKHLSRVSSGDVSAEGSAEVLEPAPATSEESVALEVCPHLGFVDDATRHYSRATALHRCFAGGAPSLVTSQDQRQLCLSGRHPTCPRFRAASMTKSPVPPPATVSAPQPVVSPKRAAISSPGVPAGVAARMEAVTQMRLASTTPTEGEAPRIGQRDQEPSVSKLVPRVAHFGLRSQRGLLLLAIGGGLGLVVLMGGLVVAVGALTGGLAPKPANVAAQSFEPVPTAIRARTSVTRPPPVPALAPTVTASPQPATPATRSVANPAVPTRSSAVVVAAASAVAVAVPVPSASQLPIDVRFASGPKPGWLDNPPYATWSDGAYRVQARQATRFVAVGVPTDTLLTDVVVSATFRKTGGPPGGGYGLIIRDQSPDPLDGINQDANAYVMETGDLGEFGVWRRDGDHWVDLVPWTRSSIVRPGGSPNDLVARAIGDQLTFIVNDTEIAAVQDDTLKAGGVGVFVGGDYNAVALDRFAVQVPD